LRSRVHRDPGSIEIPTGSGRRVETDASGQKMKRASKKRASKKRVSKKRYP